MSQKRKIITASDLRKIIQDEREYIECNFGKGDTDTNDPLTNNGSVRNSAQAERDIEICFEELAFTYDFHHDAGKMIDADDSSEDCVYKFPASGDAIPCFGAILPAGDFPAVEKISKMRYTIPVHIQFFDDPDKNHPVKEEIILLYATSAADALLVAKLCNCDFVNWIAYLNHEFIVFADVTKYANLSKE